MAVELCHGCFAAPRSASACRACGYREGRRSPLVLPPGTNLSLGGQYSQYIVGRVLGKPGGFGITYLGWHSGLQQRVAIKEFLPRDWAGREPGALTVAPHSEDDDELFRYGLEQFLQEARTLGRINHPNVVRVRDFFEQNGTAYLVMDYYEGMSLSEYVGTRGGKLGEAEAVRLMLFVLDGLREVHRNGFLHRDIKPQNIYLRKNGQPILLDFGAARQAFGDRSRSMSVVLTAGFAPFEQYHRAGRQGPWTDLYACGATLYYLLTGDVPPEATERMERDALALLGRKLRGVSAGVIAAVERSLALRPEERPQSVDEFQALLGVERAAPVAIPAAAPAPGWQDAGAPADMPGRGAGEGEFRDGAAAAVRPVLAGTAPAAPGSKQSASSSEDTSVFGTGTGSPLRRRRWFQTVSWTTVLLIIGVGGKLGWNIWQENQYRPTYHAPYVPPTRPDPSPTTAGGGLVPIDRSQIGGGASAGGGVNTGGTGRAATGDARAGNEQIEYASRIASAMQANCDPSDLEHRFLGLVFVVGEDATPERWREAAHYAEQARAQLVQGRAFNDLARMYSRISGMMVAAREFGPYRQDGPLREADGFFSLRVGEFSGPLMLSEAVAIFRKDTIRCVE